MSHIDDEARSLLLRRLDCLSRGPAPEEGGDPSARWIDWESQEEARAATLRRERAEVEAALRRIDEGSYGTCVSCGGPLGLQRLRAIPEARLCLGCSGRAEMA